MKQFLHIQNIHLTASRERVKSKGNTFRGAGPCLLFFYSLGLGIELGFCYWWPVDVKHGVHSLNGKCLVWEVVWGMFGVEHY